MAEEKGGEILDIAHVMFLEMIGTFIKQIGAGPAKGTLMRDSMALAEHFPEQEYASLEDMVAAIEDASNPITKVEGRAKHLGDGLFGLPDCPFAKSIGAFKKIHGKLPDSFAKVPQDFNKPSPTTKKLKVGHGAGVSPFCAIHQPLRSSLATRVRIGGEKVAVYQLGCKSGGGKKAIAEDLVAQTKFDTATVDKVLDDHMCCYAVVTEVES
jgi:hypothetical protein